MNVINRAGAGEFSNLLNIKDNFPKMVVSMDELAGTDYQGIRHIHILDFLQLHGSGINLVNS
jgi:hypothetical protein